MNIKKILLLFILIFHIILIINPQTENISFKLEIPKEQRKNQYFINPYFFTHYFYLYFIYKFDLDQKISLKDKSKIIKKLYKNINSKYPIKLLINDFKNNRTLIISLRTLNHKNKNSDQLLILTNYNFELDKIAESEEELKGAYANLYYIKNNKIIKNNDIYAEETEKKLLNNNNLNNLADYYLFDDNEENDKCIEKYLINFIKKTDDKINLFFSKITLVQYYISVQEFIKAKKQINELKIILKDDSIENDKSYIRFFNIIEEEYKITMDLFK